MGRDVHSTRVSASLTCMLLLLQVLPSPVAGQGVFATQDIAEGTVIGGYPGRPRQIKDMAAKAAAAPASKGYCFRCAQGERASDTAATQQRAGSGAVGGMHG